MSLPRGPLLSPAPITPIITGAVYNATAPAPQDTQGCALQCDSQGNLLVNVAVGGGGGGSNNVNLIQVGGVAFALGQQLAALSLPVVLTAAQIAALTPLSTVTVLQGTSPWVVSGTVAVSNFPATQPVSGTVAVSNFPATVAVTQSTSPWVVSGTVAISGTVAVTQSGTWTVGISAGQTIAVTNTGTFAVQATVTGTVAVSNFPATVAVTQSTSPWVVSGTVTANAGTGTFTVGGTVAVSNFPATQPVSGTVTVLQGTSPWVVSGTVTTTPSGLQNVNVTEWNTVALGSPSAYGTPPGAVNVIGVNAFITNTPAVTLASTTITGTVAVTQSTSPWVVSLASTTVTNTVAENLIQVAGVSLGATAVTNFGTAPAAAAVPGVNASLFAGTTGITATGSSLNVDVTNTVPVTLASTTITGTVAVTQSTSPWIVAGSLTNNNAAPTATLIGVLGAIAETAYNTVTYTTGDMVLPVTDLHGAFNEDLQAVAGVQLGATSVVAYGSTPAAVNVEAVNAFVTNTVPITFNTGAGNTNASFTGTSLNVNVTDFPATQVIVGNKSNNSVAPGSTNLGVLPAIANAATQTWTEGDQVLLSVDLSGRQRVRGTLTNNNAAPAADQLSVLPALANAASPTWTEGDQVLESVDLAGRQRVRGTLTNNNAAPTADLIEVMPAIATTAAPTYTTGDAVMLSTDLAGNLRVSPTAVGTLTNNNAAPGTINLGVLPAVANAAHPTWTEGDQVLESVDLQGSQRVTGTSGQNVAPLAFELVTGGVYNTTIPALTAGNASQTQMDSTGAQQVNTAGRKQTYRGAFNGVAPLASGAVPLFSVTGSATKIVRINRIRMSVSAATGSAGDAVLWRLSALSGGTASAGTAAKMDINNAAATAVFNRWTVAATTATTVAVLSCERYEIITAGVAVPTPYIEWLFGDNHGQELVLRGTSDFIGLFLSAAALVTTPTGDFWVEWTEE
jgi:hypothetical protein